jgi:DNA-binding SARP family transcriptional activator
MSLATGPDPVRPRLRLVGVFELTDSLRRVPVGPTTQRLLAYLAIAGRPVRRSVLAGVLCADVPEDQAAARLRSALWRLPRLGGQHVVDASAAHVQLAPAVAVDYQETENAELPSCGELVGDLLPDWDEEWVAVERERYRQVRLHALERLCDRHRRHADYDLALRAGLAAVSSDPLRESAHRRVVATHLAEGNAAEALRQYEAFRRLLRDELGLAPSAEIRALVRHLLGRPLDAQRFAG